MGRSWGEANWGEPEAAGRIQGRGQRGLRSVSALGQAGFYHQEQHVTKKHRLGEEASFPVVTRPTGENAPSGPEVVLGLISTSLGSSLVLPSPSWAGLGSSGGLAEPQLPHLSPVGGVGVGQVGAGPHKALATMLKDESLL